MRFDAYEIAYVHDRMDPTDQPYSERCDSCHYNPFECEGDTIVASYWTLYGHLPTGGVETIGDFPSPERALAILSFILGRNLPPWAGWTYWSTPA